MKIIGLRSALFILWMSMLIVEAASATVNITTSRIQYSCNGSTTVYAYPFKVYEDDDLEVITSDSSYTEATLILNTDYTVSGAGDDSGGNVTLAAGSNCPNNYTLTILRNIDITQDTDYSDGQTLTADGLESPPDKSRIIDQQFNEDLDRSLKIVKSSTLTDLTVIPGADKAIFFNSSGTGLVTRAFGSSTLAIPADESIIADMINTVGIPATLTKMSVYTKAEVDAAKLDLSGGTMTGDIVLAGDPDAALKAATRQYVDARVPASAIMAFPLASPPSGWLECDGSAISRTIYADLFTAISDDYGVGDGSTTFNLPDYRGEFLRGWDHGAGTDPDAASRTDRGDGTTGDNVGTKQNHELDSHIHNIPYQAGNNVNATAGATGYLQNAAITTDTSSTGGNETRPTNVNVMYCIKY